jgi:hypothetical protein
MTPLDVNTLLSAGAAGLLDADGNIREPAHEQPPEPQPAMMSHAQMEEQQTAAFARATHAMNVATLALLAERGLISEADALGAIDRARGFAATEAGAVTPWQIADAVLVDAGRALNMIFDEMRARASGAINASRH